MASQKKIPEHIKRKMRKTPPHIFPIIPAVKINKKDLVIKIKCYICTKNKASNYCLICHKPLCKRCTTRNPKGYCGPCKAKHFRMVSLTLE